MSAYHAAELLLVTGAVALSLWTAWRRAAPARLAGRPASAAASGKACPSCSGCGACPSTPTAKQA